jgi:hypothetical protein
MAEIKTNSASINFQYSIFVDTCAILMSPDFAKDFRCVSVIR